MSDVEEGDDTGIGTLAAYQLGRWSAESDAELDRSIVTLRRARNGAAREIEFTAANQALAEANNALLIENAQLRQELAVYKHNHGRLREWADKAGPENDRLRSDLADSRHDYARLQEWADKIEPLLASRQLRSD